MRSWRKIFCYCSPVGGGLRHAPLSLAYSSFGAASSSVYIDSYLLMHSVSLTIKLSSLASIQAKPCIAEIGRSNKNKTFMNKI